MNRALWHGKRSMKQWELDRQMDSHQERLRNIRPSSREWQWHPQTLNPNKRFMFQENKFTEMERENRFLIEKMTQRTNKSAINRDQDKGRMHRSLNAPFRRKQMESIQAQNARIVKRLQQRRSDYNRQKLKQLWKKQKEVIKNISHYPLSSRASSKVSKRRTLSKNDDQSKARAKSSLDADVQLARLRTIDGENFVVTIRLVKDKIVIVGNNKKAQDKVIEIPKEEAVSFIECQCDGNLQGLFDRLSYDSQQDVLYLLGKEGMKAIQENTLVNEDSIVGNF